MRPFDLGDYALGAVRAHRQRSLLTVLGIAVGIATVVLLTALGERREDGRRLLDDTIVLYGSNMGDSNTHDNTNLPILLAGGRLSVDRHLLLHQAAAEHLPQLAAACSAQARAEARRQRR
jgi:hypothetical protein